MEINWELVPFFRCKSSINNLEKQTFCPKNSKKMWFLFFIQRSITLPRPPLKGRMQPLLHVALSLRYARTIKGPACFFCCDYAWLVAFFLSGDRSLTSLLFISSDNRRKGTKEDCYPQGPLQRGMQPLLLVALSLRYARTVKGPAYFFATSCIPSVASERSIY